MPMRLGACQSVSRGVCSYMVACIIIRKASLAQKHGAAVVSPGNRYACPQPLQGLSVCYLTYRIRQGTGCRLELGLLSRASHLTCESLTLTLSTMGAQVVGPDRPGRRVAVVGECAASASLTRWAHDCDVIVHTASSRVRMRVL